MINSSMFKYKCCFYGKQCLSSSEIRFKNKWIFSFQLSWMVIKKNTKTLNTKHNIQAEQVLCCPDNATDRTEVALASWEIHDHQFWTWQFRQTESCWWCNEKFSCLLWDHKKTFSGYANTTTIFTIAIWTQKNDLPIFTVGGQCATSTAISDQTARGVWWLIPALFLKTPELLRFWRICQWMHYGWLYAI